MKDERERCPETNGRLRCSKRVHEIGDHVAVVPDGDPNGRIEIWNSRTVVLHFAPPEPKPAAPRPVPKIQSSAKRAPLGMGYSGDQCSQCGSMRVVRTGTCGTCQDCGTTTGCG